MTTPPPPPPPPAPPPPPPPPPAAPAKGSNRTLIVVLCILGGLFLIIGGCVATCTYVVHKKAKEYSMDVKKDPQLATISLIASINPNLQVVSKDAAARKITIKNKKTGETVTLDLNELSSDNMEKAVAQFAKGQKVSPPEQPAAEESEPAAAPATRAETPTEEATATEPAPAPAPKISSGKAAAMAATAKRFPAYVSLYPGGQTTEATLQSFGPATVGAYEFLTSDGPEDVAGYYEKKLTAAGLKIGVNNSGANDNGATAMLFASTADGQGNVTVNAETQAGGKVKVTVAFTSAKK